MDPAAERRQDAQPPVAQLVAEPLDDDPAVRRERPGRPALVVEVGEQVRGRPVVEVVGLLESGRGGRPAARAVREVRLRLADERPDGLAQFDRPPDRVAVPERQLARDARRRADRHPVVPDVLDPPAAGAERDDLAGPALVDHLLVELADPPAGRPRLADHEHAVQAAVRDRAAARDRDDAGIPAALDDVGDAVPHDPWLELGEFVRRVGAGEHPEHALEHVAGEGLVRGRPVQRSPGGRPRTMGP